MDDVTTTIAAELSVPGEKKRVFSLQFVIAIVLNVAFLVFYSTKEIGKLEEVSTAVGDIRKAQEKYEQKNTIIEADLSLIKSRVAILEVQVSELKEEIKNKK